MYELRDDRLRGTAARNLDRAIRAAAIEDSRSRGLVGHTEDDDMQWLLYVYRRDDRPDPETLRMRRHCTAISNQPLPDDLDDRLRQAAEAATSETMILEIAHRLLDPPPKAQ